MRQFSPMSFSVCLSLLLAASLQVVRADDQGDLILKEVAAATKATKTLSADMILTQTSDKGTTTTLGTVKLKKPNFAHIVIDTGKPSEFSIASDGKNVWLSEKVRKRYQKNVANPDGSGLASFTIIPVGMFMEPGFRGFIEPSIKSTRFVGNETLDETTYQVVEILGDKPYHFVLKCYVGKDKLVSRTSLQLKLGAQTLIFETVLKNVKLNTEMPDSDFAYTPPADAVFYDPSEVARHTKDLLSVGNKAPRFSARTPSGNVLTLEDALKGKKAVLISFWYHSCVPCRKEFPLLQKLYDDFKGKGLEIVAMNETDSAETVSRFIADSKLTFLFGLTTASEGTAVSVSKKYGVISCPTNYLLDAEGNVIWRGIGFEEDQIRAELKKLGIK